MRAFLVASCLYLGLLSQARASPPSSSSPEAWLRGYLAIATSNPPGNESPGAAFLAAILHRHRVATRTFVAADGRASLYARLEAATSGAPTLVLLHHIDVVPPGEGWSVNPFSGSLEQGKFWGRGAIDDKSLGIAQLAAFLDVADQRQPPPLNLVFLAVADEEAGGGLGMAWLLEHHPDLFAGDVTVLGEGGANRMVANRLLWWGIEVAQKRPLWLRLEARGRAGHGSGLNPHSAAHQLVQGLARALTLFDDAPLHVSKAALTYFGALAPLHSRAFSDVFGQPTAEAADQALQEALDAGHSMLLPGMDAFLVDTLQLTQLGTSSNAVNVVGADAWATLDLRLLPDTDQDAVLRRLQAAVGEEIAVQIVLSTPTTPQSSTDTAVYRALAVALKREQDVPVIPSFILGTTDSRYLRQRGIHAYGFSPFLLNSEDLQGIHSANEAIRRETFLDGVECMRRAVRLILEAAAESDS